MSLKWTPMAFPVGVKAALINQGASDCRAFSSKNGLRVVQTIDSGAHGKLRHVSVSHPERYPTWEEIKEVKERFFGPDQDTMMVLPRKELYVNLHRNCFHLWQMPFRWEYM